MFKVMKIVEAHLVQAEQKLTLVKQVKGRGKKKLFLNAQSVMTVISGRR